MALSFDDMSQEYTDILDLFNDIFTFIFAAEAAIKIGGEFPSLYFSQPWNQYDFFVVAVTLTEFTYTRVDPTGEIPGASILVSVIACVLFAVVDPDSHASLHSVCFALRESFDCCAN